MALFLTFGQSIPSAKNNALLSMSAFAIFNSYFSFKSSAYLIREAIPDCPKINSNVLPMCSSSILFVYHGIYHTTLNVPVYGLQVVTEPGLWCLVNVQKIFTRWIMNVWHTVETPEILGIINKIRTFDFLNVNYADSFTTSKKYYNQ